MQLKRLKLLDQLLALWIILAMALGIILGALVPGTAVVLEKVQFVGVSLPIGASNASSSLSVPLGRTFLGFHIPAHPRALAGSCADLNGLDAAIALIVMMWPILCRVSPGSLIPLFRRRQLWQHLAFSVVVNWIVSPLLMLGLAWAFLPDKEDLREGLIVVGVARCIAMVREARVFEPCLRSGAHRQRTAELTSTTTSPLQVLVWTDIAGGDLDCEFALPFDLRAQDLAPSDRIKLCWRCTHAVEPPHRLRHPRRVQLHPPDGPLLARLAPLAPRLPHPAARRRRGSERVLLDRRKERRGLPRYANSVDLLNG